MTCPKCEEGSLKKVQFMPNGELAFLCDSCQTVWLSGETITRGSGHALGSYVPQQGYEYYIDIFDDKDQDHRALIDEVMR